MLPPPDGVEPAHDLFHPDLAGGFVFIPYNILHTYMIHYAHKKASGKRVKNKNIFTFFAFSCYTGV